MVEVVQTGVPLLEKIVDFLVDPIKRQFTYMCCFNSNITELETQLKDLETTRRGVQMGVEENRRKVRVIGPNVEAWQTRANEVTTEVEGIIQDKAKVKEGCLNGWCPNLKLRYSLSRKAVKKTKVVVDLKADGVQYTQSFYSPPPACLETITNRDFTGFESRRLIMEEIIKALKDDEINLIGVCGMGGVGKTTLVNEVAKRAKEDNHFDEVAIAVVSQEPNLTNVQAYIADMLGLKNLRDTESPIARADLLRRRLSQDNKKVLVILDDIWAEFDLQAMGIPLEGADKNFKVLYTSRTRYLWHEHQRTKKEILLEPLSEDEAWQLFKEKVGDSADAMDLQPIAKQIVKKCGCLPLALALIGSALSKELLKGCGRNAIKICNGMLDRLTCAKSIPADKQLSSCMELSYKCLEDEAKSLFLLCCLFKEDEDIRLEDLARYGFGLSLFDGMNQMGKVRDQVVLIVNDLKSRYLLQDSREREECVKVHDVVRDMGISIASKEREKDVSILSKDKFALVSHGAISQWPKTATPEHYTAISVISGQIEELPEELTYRNLEFLMLRCKKLEKLPPNFFGGMGKLKVLELRGVCGIPTLQSLRNLTTLSLEGFGGTLDNISVMGDLQNLETLNFRGSEIKELPEEIGKLVQLRLLDLRRTYSLTRIKPGVISRLFHLEELYFWGSKYCYWEGEGKKGEVRNANLGEFESLSNLNTLEIFIRSHVIIPKVQIFSKLKIYRVVIADEVDFDSIRMNTTYLIPKFERLLWVRSSIPIPLDRGGIGCSLLSSSDCLRLEKEGCNDLVRELLLRDMLKVLELGRLPNLREICCGPVPAGSLEELTSIKVSGCERLENLFKLPIEGCLTRQEDVHVATNNIIVFPKLKVLNLGDLPRLVGFCRGIDQIDFPQLKCLYLKHLGGFNRLFDNNCNLASNSEENDNVGFLSLFPGKVSLPNLEELIVSGLQNLERLGHGSLSVGSLSKLKEFTVTFCRKLLCVFPSQLLSMLRELQELTLKSCDSLEVVFELEGLESNEPNPEILSPRKLIVKLRNLPKLNCISKRDPVGFKYIHTLKIHKCNSLSYVFAPTMTKSIPQVRELKISSCKMLSRIVAEENGLGESSVDKVEFPQLERLELLDLPNLLSFFPNVNVNGNTTTLAKSTDHYHNPLQPHPLFNEKVAFPGLEYLGLSGLETVSDLWCSDLPTSSFSKLKTLNVRGFTNLRSTFHPSIVGGLANLSELVIVDCSKMEGVVYWEEEIEDGQGRKIEKTLFPLLRKLLLLSLPNLVSFFPNVNVNGNTTALAKSTNFYHNPLQPQPLFNEKVAIPSLEYLELSGLETVSDLWCSEPPTSSFSQLKTLNVRGFTNLRSMFHPSIVRGLANLSELVITDCSKMEGVVYWEEEIEDGQGRKVEKTLFPLLRKLQLSNLPNLVSFFLNVNVNTTTLAKSNDHLYNPMQPQPLFNVKVAFPCLKYLGLSGLQNVSDLWGSELPTHSFSKLKNLQVTDPTSLRNKVCILWINDLNNTTQGLLEVARLLYTDYGDGVLALGSNGTMKLWKWKSSEHNPRGKVTTSVLPQLWEPPPWGSAMTNDVTGVNLEEAVPCVALSKDYSTRYIISACGGKVSLYNSIQCRVERTFMPPPPASTFLAFYPQDNNIIAIGMEDFTIRIYNHQKDEVKSELKGHKKRITGLTFSTNLNILVSSAADAQLCIWSTNTWEHLKAVSIQLSAGKACNGDTRVEFHSDQIRMLVSHETQLAIYDASVMDCIRQWVPQDVLLAPISFAVYSCDSQLVYTSFCDGNTGVFDADSLTLACCIVPSIYLCPTILSGGQALYPRVIAAHPKKPNQFAIGFTNGFVVLMEPQESNGKWGLSPSTVDNGMLNDRTTSSSNTSNHTTDQNGDGPMARSMEKPKTLDDVTDKSKPWKVAETQCQLVVMPDSTDEAHKVARLLYRSGCEVLALGCNGALRLWRRYSSKNNQSGKRLLNSMRLVLKATASVVPQQWQPASGLAMTNDVTGVNLEEAVPCMALSKNYSNIISACGGAISLFDARTFTEKTKFTSPPPASTFLAFRPQDDEIIAIGMEDSTIRIYNYWVDKVESELKGHKKRITGLAFSTNLNILVSSGADAQLCLWSIDKFEHLKSVPVQLPAGKACNGDTRVQFHSDEIHLLVSHETQLAIYDASEMDHIRQWVPQDVLPAPISFAAYSCDGQLVYTSFCDGNIGVFDADSLTLTCYISPSVYFPTLSSGSQAVYPTVVATHPWKPNHFAIGLTNGSVILIEPPESEGKWGLSATVYHKGMLNDRIASSSNTSNHKPDQKLEVDVDKKLEVDLGIDKDVDVDVDEDEEDQEERKKKEKGKAPQSG
ncbi:uncharacterized protein LOC131319541 isoform X4 [Rhododendron vialii]|uniref:uncharacterized protein LOC131319541 isoform X4 n=1 Tax=Rhododendron vialii TaxID=182163 RepID=UPI00265D63EC|nr:uncharacterized protein LOC131319541 isoform X4 [Rhododendron vialii]